MNLFLYIIWSTAYDKKNEILADMNTSFRIHKIIEIEWTKEKFSDNLSRFYGQKLPKNSFKEKACGTDPFTLVIVEDESPVYELRKTSRGEDEKVNIHTFDKKTLYRQWTQQGKKIHSRIHGTNSPEETEHDLTLLLGMAPDEFVKKESAFPDKLKQDLVGANGWDSIEQMFYVLNHTCRYVVLRNFEGLPESFHVGGHDDIDILTDSYEEIRRICNGSPVFKKNYRVQCLCSISKTPTQFDFRFVGDGYYDYTWEKRILENRKLKNGIYIPDNENYKYMILYHALVHKLYVADDYKNRLNSMFGEANWGPDNLTEFLKESGYKYTEPNDLTVYFNPEIVNTSVSTARKRKMAYITYKKTLKKTLKKILGEKS